MINRYLYAIHEAPPLQWLNEHMTIDGKAAGWIVHTHELGHGPEHTGYDYSRWADLGYGQIARLNNGYSPNGTIPLSPDDYADFATRCAWWVANSQGCNHWIVGNEPNSSTEGLIPPQAYAACFKLVYRAIKNQQPDSIIMPAPVAMWNAESWDWLAYYRDVLNLCAPFDAICWHTYCHGSDPTLIRSMQVMDSPYEERLFHFRAFWDLWGETPAEFANLPIYITETNQGDIGGVPVPWLDEQNTWIQDAYSEIDDFNRGHDYQIRCLACYRWPKYDEWYIDGKSHIHADFHQAVTQGYTWQKEQPPMNDWHVIFETEMDDGFYDYGSIGELTVPNGSHPLWEHDGNPPTDLVRPEYDHRTIPHAHTPPNAAGMFSMDSTMEAAIVFEIRNLKPGTEIRASIWAMGRDIKDSGLGMRIGIATEHPGIDAIEVDSSDGKFTGELQSRAQWGEWLPDMQEGEWGLLWSPVVEVTGSRAWILLNGRKDWAHPGHTHWDDLAVEARGNGGIEPPIPPGPGTTHIIRTVTWWDDQIVSDQSAEVACGDVDPQVCELAQQIVALTCQTEKS